MVLPAGKYVSGANKATIVTHCEEKKEARKEARKGGRRERKREDIPIRLVKASRKKRKFSVGKELQGSQHCELCS